MDKPTKKTFRERFYLLLRYSERYFKTDMVYLTKSGFWINLGYIVASVLSLGIAIAFAHFVSMETYGTYKYIISAAAIFTAFSLTGMNMAVVRATAQGFEGVFKKSLYEQFLWSIPQFLMLCAVGGYYFYQGNSAFGWSFIAISILAPISSIANTYGAYLTGKKDFRTQSIYGIFSNFFNFLAIGGAIIFSQNLLLMILVFYTTRTVINLFFCWKTFHNYKPNSLFRAEDITYGKHMSVMNILGEISSHIENIIVFHLLGPASVAIYSFATILPDRLKSLFAFVGTAALSRMSEKKNFEVGKNIKHKITLLVLIGFAMALCYMIIAPFIFSLLFPQYGDSVFYSQIFSISIIVIAANIPVGALYAKKLQKELYILSIASPLIKIIIFILGTYYFGLIGAIISKVVYSFIQLAIPTQLLFSNEKNKKEATN